MQVFMTFITNHPVLSGIFALLLLLLLVVEILRASGRHFLLDPQQVISKINHENAVLLDLQADEAYKSGHIINAQHCTLKSLEENPKKIEKYRSRPIILICQTGTVSQKTAALLIKSGYNAYSLKGGMRAWYDANMPFVKG